MPSMDEPLLRLEGSAEEFLLFRRDGALWLRRALYVADEQIDSPVHGLDDVLAILKDTALPFCDVTWLVPEGQRPAGHERLDERIAVMVDDFRAHAATVRFTM